MHQIILRRKYGWKLGYVDLFPILYLQICILVSANIEKLQLWFLMKDFKDHFN